MKQLSWIQWSYVLMRRRLTMFPTAFSAYCSTLCTSDDGPSLWRIVPSCLVRQSMGMLAVHRSARRMRRRTTWKNDRDQYGSAQLRDERRLLLHASRFQIEIAVAMVSMWVGTQFTFEWNIERVYGVHCQISTWVDGDQIISFVEWNFQNINWKSVTMW